MTVEARTSRTPKFIYFTDPCRSAEPQLRIAALVSSSSTYFAENLQEQGVRRCGPLGSAAVGALLGLLQSGCFGASQGSRNVSCPYLLGIRDEKLEPLGRWTVQLILGWDPCLVHNAVESLPAVKTGRPRMCIRGSKVEVYPS